MILDTTTASTTAINQYYHLWSFESYVLPIPLFSFCWIVVRKEFTESGTTLPVEPWHQKSGWCTSPPNGSYFSSPEGKVVPRPGPPSVVVVVVAGKYILGITHDKQISLSSSSLSSSLPSFPFGSYLPPSCSSVCLENDCIGPFWQNKKTFFPTPVRTFTSCSFSLLVIHMTTMVSCCCCESYHTSSRFL